MNTYMKYSNVLFVALMLVIFAGYPATTHAALTSTGLNSQANQKCTGSLLKSSLTSTDGTTNTITVGNGTGQLPSDYATSGKYCIQETDLTSSCSLGTTANAFALYNTSSTIINNGTICPDPPKGSGVSYITYTYATPTVTLSAASPSITAGASDQLTWGVSGVPSATCTGTGTGFTTGSGMSGVVSVTPSTTTTYSVSCTYAGSTSSASATVTVYPVLSASGVSCTVSSTHNPTLMQQLVSWSATITSGTPPYTYLWGGDGALAGSTTSNPSVSYLSGGVKSGTVRITDSSSSKTTSVQTTQIQPGQCTGSLTGYSFTDTQDGATTGGYGPGGYGPVVMQNAADAFSDVGLGWPADFYANPQNYCVQALDRLIGCGQLACSYQLKIQLYSTNATIPSSGGTQIGAVTGTFGSGAPSVVQICSPTLTVNSAPSAPALVCPTSAVVGYPASTTATAVDVDGDTIRYGVSWTNGSTMDSWLPAGNTYVPSGTPQTFTHTWNTPGTYTIGLLAQDVNGQNSTTTTCTINVTNPSNLTPTNLSPIPPQGGTNVLFIGSIRNTGGDAAAFPSQLFICKSGDTACEAQTTSITNTVQNISMGNPSFFDKLKGSLFAFLGTSHARADAVTQIQLAATAIAGSTTGTQTAQTTWAAPASGGSYEYKLCADSDATGNIIVPVTSRSALCGTWTSMPVTLAAALTAADATPISAVAGQAITVTGLAKNIGLVASDASQRGFWNNFQVCDPTSAGSKGNINGNCTVYNYLNGGETGGYWVNGSVPAGGTTPLTYSFTPPATQPYVSLEREMNTNFAMLIKKPSLSHVLSVVQTFFKQVITPAHVYASGGSYTLAYRWCADENTLWDPTINVSNSGTQCGGWGTMTVALPTVSCTADTPSPSSAVVAQQVTWKAGTATGFASTPTYTWSDGGILGGYSGAIGGNTGSTYTNYYKTGGAGYYVTLVGTLGGSSASQQCPIVTVTAPTVTLTATPNRVQKNTAGVVLTWTSANLTDSYDTCTLSGNGNSWTSLPSTSTSGTQKTDPNAVTAQTTYTITCHSGTNARPGTDVSGTATVNIVPVISNF